MPRGKKPGLGSFSTTHLARGKGRANNEMVVMRNDPTLSQHSTVQQVLKQKRDDLPHLYGWKWYRWARIFYESRNKINLLTAGNQATKSSSVIRKNIEWACNKKLWPELWPEIVPGVPNTPRIFFYLYPSNEVATVEFEKKWVPNFMPRGAMKSDEQYGWDADYNGKDINAVHFRSGVSIYFKSYSQQIRNLQTATVHMVSGDEEMPEEFVDELTARLSSTGGYFNVAFTATQGLQIWYRAMECIGSSEETFKQAHKQVVSLYDCQVYEDGTPGHWPLERIKEREAQCTSEAEILRRVHGRFVKDEGRKFSNFLPSRNLGLASEKVPSDWKWYGGVDVGSGGKGRSAGAVLYLAVNPSFTKGRVTRTWRGDHQETTAGDILQKYRELKGLKDEASNAFAVTQACYDYQSREFALIASRSGEPFLPANKDRDGGTKTVNVLFQSGALTVDEGVYDNQKLVTELMSVPAGDKNRRFQDDLSDTLRYVVQLIPWDFARIEPQGIQAAKLAEEDFPDVPDVNWTPQQYLAWEIEMRRGRKKPKDDGWQEMQEEFDELNEAYGN